ncbi:MAG: DUF3943 domain-containing protein [Deltaproteobacteria bacterium]|nr:DUF3943 domain-containing protein [Deltaproteobacteria bacterium]
MSRLALRTAVLSGAMAAMAAIATLVQQGRANAIERDTFVDSSGRARPFRDTYLDWFGEKRRRPHLLRATIEDVGVAGLGVLHYWVQRHANQSDWDQPSPVDRFTLRAVRFDNNLFTTNNILHPLAGAAYYGMPRVNGFDPHEAFLAVLVASTFWEFALEWREKVSINDLIVTPVGGMVIGEFLFQLGEYVTSAPGRGLAQEIAAVTLGAPRRAHDAFDRPRKPAPLPPDALGFSSAFWHRFRLASGATAVSNDAGKEARLQNIVAEAQIVSVPGFLDPGRFHLLFGEGNFTELRLRMEVTDDGLEDFDLWLEADIVGYYSQRIEPASHGQAGHGVLVAFANAFRDADRWVLGRRDQLAVAHFAAAVGRLWFGAGGLWLRLGADLSGDFASVRSLAFEPWILRNGIDGTKTVLSKQGYYFALGYSARLRAVASYRGIEVGGHLAYGDYGSIDGLDRWQEQVSRDVGGDDQILEYGAWIQARLPWLPVVARASSDQVVRWSRLEKIRDSRWDRRMTATLGLQF